MNFTVLSMEIHITNRLPFYFLIDGLFVSAERSKQITDKNKSNVIRKGLNFYYCFNSKGDNFDVMQFKHTTKN